MLAHTWPGTLRRRFPGFTLVELLVVMGIISVLISILLPAVNKAREQANAVACASNLRQVGMFLVMYANDNNGWMYPDGLGTTRPDGSARPPSERWPTLVFQPPQPNPAVMICPADTDMGGMDKVPEDKHSYILNHHIYDDGVKYGHTRKVPATEIIVIGEKKTAQVDYYMQVLHGQSEYSEKVETQRHGRVYGSNLLFLDGHADHFLPPQFAKGYGGDANYPWDPWDIYPN
jgi:prepilin-type N-terminal cleavage/methylation domain-containing protein/prepilin-type processing-associated H-X9-DG protein